MQRIYNVFGDPVYEKATNAGGENPCISTWRYDSLGRLVHAVCDGHSYEYAYDSHGNLKEKRSNGKLLVSYTYDSTGNITEIKDPAGVSTRYEYDLLGRMSCIHSGQGMKVQYGYDSLDRIEHIHYGNGVQTTYAYDCDGNISHLETRTESAVLLSFDYQYDGNGNRTAKTGIQGLTAGSSALDIRYQYDVRGQLLEECRNGAAVRYAYDAAGNRIRKTEGEKETRYRYNQKNQLLQKEDADGISCFTYDRQGGIIEEKTAAGNRRFTYNSLHQQTQVETETGNIQKNRYDAEGLRYELIENGRRTSFVYHNGELLHEKGEEAGLSQEATSYHLGAGIEAFQRDRKTFYYHQDEQLNTTLISDEKVAIRNHYQYDVFGAGLEAVEELPNRIRYAGQQYDEQTEQYYLRARYYNSALGRFMQEDVYQGDGLNLYAYCRNNPVMYYDPSGYSSTKMKAKSCTGKTDDDCLVSDKDIEDLRKKYNNPLNSDGTPKNTVAVGRCNIPKLEEFTFEGAAPQVIKRANELRAKTDPKFKKLDELYPDRTIKSEYKSPFFTRHAEEMVMADFEHKLKEFGYTDKIEGDLYIIQSNPRGVCPQCTALMYGEVKSGNTGIFVQFMRKYPNIRVHVSTYKGGGGTKGSGTLSFDIEKGEIKNVVKN